VDATVVGLANAEVAETLREAVKEDQYVLDLVSLQAPETIKERYQGVC